MSENVKCGLPAGPNGLSPREREREREREGAMPEEEKKIGKSKGY
jgi:hypothetical protein